MVLNINQLHPEFISGSPGALHQCFAVDAETSSA
jgi:hypothetical protein